MDNPKMRKVRVQYSERKEPETVQVCVKMLPSKELESEMRTMMNVIQIVMNSIESGEIDHALRVLACQYKRLLQAVDPELHDRFFKENGPDTGAQ